MRDSLRFFPLTEEESAHVQTWRGRFDDVPGLTPGCVTAASSSASVQSATCSCSREGFTGAKSLAQAIVCAVEGRLLIVGVWLPAAQASLSRCGCGFPL